MFLGCSQANVCIDGHSVDVSPKLEKDCVDLLKLCCASALSSDRMVCEQLAGFLQRVLGGKRNETFRISAQFGSDLSGNFAAQVWLQRGSQVRYRGRGCLPGQESTADCD